MIHPDAAVEIRYRPMQLADVEQVYDIDVLSFALPWSERSYRFEITENPTSRTWVAEAVDAHGQTQVVAMIVVWVILDEAHVATIAVHPDYRRRGLASACWPGPAGCRRAGRHPGYTSKCGAATWPPRRFMNSLASRSRASAPAITEIIMKMLC